MLKLKNKNIEFPERYPLVERGVNPSDGKGWVKVDGKKLRKDIDFAPQQGMQEWMFTVEVDILFLGGQPTGGKTFGILMSALDGVEKPGYGALIIKKELTSTKDSAGGIIQDAKRVIGKFSDCEYTSSDSPTFRFPSWGTSVTFTHSNFSGDSEKSVHAAQEKAKNTQCSHIFFDELTDHDFPIWTYWLSRNRDASGVPPKMICTFNTNSHHFTRRMIDWYIGEDGQVRPERIGKVRYFINQGKTERDIVWGNSREEVLKRTNIVVPKDLAAKGITPDKLIKSFSFMPCKMADNGILMDATGGAHVASIFNMGEEETQKLFHENWNTESEGESTITKKEIRAIFKNPIDNDTTMYASLDVSGGKDKCFMFIWRGNTIIGQEELKRINDDEHKEWYRKLTVWIEVSLKKWDVPMENFAYDATGAGSYLKSFTSGIPVTMNAGVIQEVDVNGNPVKDELFYNLRSQLMGKAEYIIKAGILSCSLDPEMLIRHNGTENKELVEAIIDEKDVFRKTTKNSKTYYNSKNEFKARHHFSPDIMDTIVIKCRFLLDARPRKAAQRQYSINEYYAALNR